MNKEEKVSLGIVILCICILIWLFFFYPDESVLRQRGYAERWKENQN